MSTINFGGLATGLDTNSIIDQLVGIERRRQVGLLEIQQLEATASQSALATFNTKLTGVLSAAAALRDSSSSLDRKASSSDETIIEATAGSGALTGSTQITVNTLAREAIATSSTGLTSETDTVASGAGTFEFQVGSGATQTVNLTGSTTLADLASEINNLGAGATASVVNVGTTASPDYRLRLSSDQTGSSSAVSITNDGTTIGVSVTQTAQNASLTVSGFATNFTRESNVVSDVIPGVTLELEKTGGPVTINVATDESAVSAKLQAVVDSFNDLASFVDQNSEVVQDTTTSDGDVAAGPLAFDSTVRTILDGLRNNISNKVSGLGSQYTLLAELGIESTQEGKLKLDASKLTTALSSDEDDVLEFFAGSGTNAGVFDRIHDYVSDVTKSGGILEIRTTGVADELESLQQRIETGERNVDAYEGNLRAKFTSLEVLVSGLQSQSSFLLSALGGTQPQ